MNIDEYFTLPETVESDDLRAKPEEALKQTAQDAAELAKLSAIKNPTADDKKKIAELEAKLAP